MSIVSIAHSDGIAIVRVDNPPVNALSQALRHGLWEAVGTLDADPSVRAVVLACAGRTFIAGADVTEFGKPPVPPLLPDLVDRLEGAAKPWVAAIHGSALGGGFEVAMGCRFRVALDSASVGLPEVALGIIPGASGTVRTPRLAGVATAVDLVTTGRPVRAARAQDRGLVDSVVSGDLVAQAVAFARAAVKQPLPPPISARPVTSPEPAWWEEQRAAISRRAPGEVAPLRALDCLRVAAEKPFAEALAHERAIFLELRGSAQAAAMRHVFFAERAAPRPARLAEVRPREIRVVAVVEGGETAGRIVAALREAGLEVHVIAEDGVRALDAATRNMLGEADLLVEAGAGSADHRQEILVGLDRVGRSDAVVATVAADDTPLGTSEGPGHSGRCIRVRLAGPALEATLLEIASFGASSPEALATGFALAKSLGMLPVLSGTRDFIGERILRRYRQAAEALVRQGIPAAEIDAALRAYGFRRGPFEAVKASNSDLAEPPLAGVASRGEGIADHIVAAMAEEGRVLLDEGAAAKASDIDLVAIHGYGFPRWRGGPMFASGIV